MKITKMTNRTTMFTVPENENYDVNMAVIFGTKHNFIIDTGTGEDCAEAMLEHVGNDLKPIVVINTHGDWDHVAGNSSFDQHTVISHKLGRDRMDQEWDNQIKKYRSNSEFFKGKVSKTLPNMVFEGELYFPEDGIRLVHTPGHKGCDITIYDEVDKILYTGDNFGIVEGKAVYWGEDITDFEKIIATYKTFDFELCISGHSEPQGFEVIKFLEATLVELKENS